MPELKCCSITNHIPAFGLRYASLGPNPHAMNTCNNVIKLIATSYESYNNISILMIQEHEMKIKVST